MSYFTSNHICGCYFTTSRDQYGRVERRYLPLVELESHTKITPVCFSTTLKQKFGNPTDNAIQELRYTFPLYDGVSVSAYTISYGDQVLQGVVKQKEVAKATYEAAVDRGETAGLLEILPAGIFGVTIGNVPAKTDVHVVILYAGELKHDAGIDGLRYTLPTSIAPRYGEYPAQLLESNSTAKGIKITIDIDMGKSAIRKVQSPTHPIAVSMGNMSTGSTSNTFQPSQGSATLTQGSTELGGDFVLQLLIDDISKPQAVLEKHASLDSRAIMATLVPKFNLPLSTPEIIFIADQSGSMSGSNTDELKAALGIFLKSLPFGVRFNICAFGSHYNYLWAKSQAYNEENFKTASEFIGTFNAQWGGTEMYEPVEQAFLRRHGDLPMEIMLLTDGEIWQESRLFDLINKNIHQDGIDARLFTLGIGRGVSHTLCEGIARAGNGFAQFVVQNEETDAKLLRMLRASLFPHTKGYSLEVNFDDREDSTDDFEIVERLSDKLHIDDIPAEKPKPATMSFFDEQAAADPPIRSTERYAHLPKVAIPSILQAPSTIPPLFPYNRCNLYLLLGPDAPQKQVVSVTLRAQAPSGPLEMTIPVYTDDTAGTVIHQLAARKAVQELEDGRGWIQAGTTVDGEKVKDKYASRLDELVEREAVRLGEAYQVAGKWCSFVATADTSEHAPDAMDSYSTPLPPPPPPPPAPQSQLFGTKAAPGSGSSGGSARARRYFRAPSSSTYASSPVMARAAVPGKKKRTGFGTTLFGGASQTPGYQASAGTGLFGASAQTTEHQMRTGGGLFGASGVQTPGYQVQPAARADQSVGMDMDDYVEEDEDVDENMGRGLFDDGPLITQTKVAVNLERAVDTGNPAAVLRALIGLQTFSGYWQWSQKLLQLVSIEIDSSPTQDDASATALVLAYLEKKMLSQRDVWDMVAQKARAWLESRSSKEEVDRLIEDAGKQLP